MLLFPLLAASAGSAIALPQPSSDNSFDWADIEHLIAFGDSYTYVQGTHGRQNYSFVGDFQNFSYTVEELLADRIVQNQTSTAEGGPNWVEFITDCGLSPGITDPRSCSTQLWDFAFAGADISAQFTALHHPFTVPFVNQTHQFATYAQPALGSFVDPSRTLVASWIGINDISDTSQWTNISSYSEFYDTLIAAQFAAISADVLSQGYSNFLFMNLPPLDRTPGNIARPNGPRPNKTMVNEWDASLSRHAQGFAETNPATTVLLFDVNTFLNGVMDNACSYGIQNVTGYCHAYDQPAINTDPASYECLALPEYFWFNTGHLTSHVHEILAGELLRFFNGMSKFGQIFAFGNGS